MHDGSLGNLTGTKLRNLLAVAQNDDAMAVADHFFEVGRNEKNGHAIGRELRH